MASYRPAYLDTLEKGRFKDKIDTARNMMRSCVLCPRRCKVDRLSGEKGFCSTGEYPRVSSFNPHFGEEAPLVGTRGSGTIFFTHCNLLCIFCQNYDISHEGRGEKISFDQLADMMLALQQSGCHNINFVTPSHVVPQILAAVEIAAQAGLTLPLVYNTGGYDNVETLKLLEGVFDIYMPDFKFWDPAIAHQTCNARDYPEIARNAVREMHRQVGDLQIDASGTARRGLLVRHLVLPSGLSGTREVMGFIARRISPNTYVNIMAQYRPCGRASEMEALSVHLPEKAHKQAVNIAKEEGVTRLDLPRRVFMIW